MEKLFNNRYEIIEKLSEGRVEDVYKVKDLDYDRIVALKMLTAQTARREGILRFKQEFLTMSRLRHPNIIEVFDFGVTEAERHFFTMEYLEGKNIVEFDYGTDYDQLYLIIVQVCRALEFIHSRGLIHFDVKPSNIMVIENDGSPLVKLMDFDLARKVDIFAPDEVRGTYGYMAPEVLKGWTPDRRADLYSLGVVLHQVVTGVCIFDGDNPVSVARRSFEKKREMPGSYNKNLPRGLEKLVMKLIEREPGERYQSATEVIHEVTKLSGLKLRAEELEQAKCYILGSIFVGRDKELKILEDILASASLGNGQIVFVDGDAGIGKSRLIREFKFQAQLRGVDFLSVACYQVESSPDGALVDILNKLSSHVEPNKIGSVKDYISDIAELSPAIFDQIDLKKIRPFAGLKLDKDRIWLFDKITNFMIQLSKDRPFVIFIDDLQWVDRVSIGLLRYLRRSIKESRIVLVGTYRTVELGESHPLISLLEDFAQEEWFTGITLQGLTLEDVRSLLASIVGDSLFTGDLSRWIFEQTSGNAFFIEEVIKSMVEDGVISRRHGQWKIDLIDFKNFKLPASLHDAIAKRLSVIDSDELNLLNTCAVIGKSCDFDILRTIVRVDEDSLFHTLDGLVKNRILVERHTPTELIYDFYHPLFQKVLYNNLEDKDKMGVHREIASALEKSHGGRIEEVASDLGYHFLKGNDNEKAIRYSIIGGDCARKIHANESAAEQYERALKLMGKTGSDGDRLKILKHLGQVYVEMSRYPKARQSHLAAMSIAVKQNCDQSALAELYRLLGTVDWMESKYDEALESFIKGLELLGPECESVQAARIHNMIGAVHCMKGDYKAAIEYVSKALNVLEGKENVSKEQASFYSNLGAFYAFEGEFDEALNHCRIALQISEDSNDNHRIAISCSNIGMIFCDTGNYVEALTYYKRSLNLEEQIGNVFWIGLIFSNLGVLYCETGDWKKSIEYQQKSLNIAEKIGDTQGAAVAYTCLGDVYEKCGLWDDADECYDSALKIPTDLDDRRTVATVYNNLGRIHLHKGYDEKAMIYLLKGLRIRKRIMDKDGEAASYKYLGCLLVEKGRWGKAHRILGRSFEIYEKEGNRQGQATALRLLGHVYLAINENAKAQLHCQQALNISTEIGDRLGKAECIVLKGMINSAMGMWDRAEECFKSSIELLKELGASYYLGRTYLEYGKRKLENKLEKDAWGCLYRAEEIFDKLGAKRDLKTTREIKHVLEGRLKKVPTIPTDSGQLTSLYKIGQIVNSILDLDDLLTRVMDLVIETMEAQRAMIALLDKETGELKVKVARNMDRQTIDDAEQLSLSIIADVVTGGEPVVAANAGSDPRFKNRKSVILHGIQSLLCAPLKSREDVIGTIYVDSCISSYLFHQKEIEFLMALANQVGIAIENASLHQELIEENKYLKKEIKSRTRFNNIIGECQKMREIFEVMDRVIESSATVLIHGESGTGKELIAQAIHYNGARRNKSFIPVTCGAMPEQLLESELFGHVKGAFTGASKEHSGLFEAADDGTLFLDEIGDTSVPMQLKILRALEEGKIRRIGDNKEIDVDVRVIAATNKDLVKLIGQKEFREDLYYRLDVLNIKLSPLREREDDVVLIANSFLKSYSKMHEKNITGFKPMAIKALMRYNWPGNVRELRNEIERAVILLDRKRKIDVSDFSESLRASFRNSKRLAVARLIDEQGNEGSLSSKLDEYEKEIILENLKKYNWNKRRTAKNLAISPDTLYRKMTKYGLDKKSNDY